MKFKKIYNYRSNKKKRKHKMMKIILVQKVKFIKRKLKIMMNP